MLHRSRLVHDHKFNIPKTCLDKPFKVQFFVNILQKMILKILGLNPRGSSSSLIIKFDLNIMKDERS